MNKNIHIALYNYAAFCSNGCTDLQRDPPFRTHEFRIYNRPVRGHNRIFREAFFQLLRINHEPVWPQKLHAERVFLFSFFPLPLKIAVELGRVSPKLYAGLVRDFAADELARASFFADKQRKTGQFFLEKLTKIDVIG